MRLLTLPAMLASPVLALAQPIGHWQQDHIMTGSAVIMGSAVTYDIEPDGRYTETIWRVMAGTRQRVQADHGTWAVRGNLIRLQSTTGRIETYKWGVMPESGGQSSILKLGDQTFYSVGPVSHGGPQGAPVDCTDEFMSCMSSRTPDEVCSRKLEICRAGR